MFGTPPGTPPEAPAPAAAADTNSRLEKIEKALERLLEDGASRRPSSMGTDHDSRMTLTDTAFSSSSGAASTEQTNANKMKWLLPSRDPDAVNAPAGACRKSAEERKSRASRFKGRSATPDSHGSPTPPSTSTLPGLKRQMTRNVMRGPVRRGSALEGSLRQVAANSNNGAASGASTDGNDAEQPRTLEDFVDEVCAKGAEQAKNLEKAVAWHLRSRRMSSWFPLLVPGGQINNAWEWLLSLSILPSIVLNPLMLGFSHALQSLHPLILALDAVYWLGILLTFATAVLPSNDELLVLKPFEIARRYATSYLLIDLIAAFPYYHVLCGFGSQCAPSTSGWFMVPSLTLLCGLRAMRIARTESARVLLLLKPRGLRSVTAHAGETTLVQLALLFLWLSHAAGCLYWYTCVAILEESALDDPSGEMGPLPWRTAYSPQVYTKTWFPMPEYANYLTPHVPALEGLLQNASATAYDMGAGGGGRTTSFANAYIYCLVWGMVHVSGVGFEISDDPRGVTCSLVVALAAIATNATLIGSVTTTLTRINASRNKEGRQRESVTAFLSDKSVPLTLQKRIHEYYDFCGGVSRQRDLLPSLPKALSFQLEIFLKRGVFLRIPFFQNCSVKQIMALVPLVASENMMPGRIFVTQGSPLDGLWMVARGKVLLQKENRKKNTGGAFGGGGALIGGPGGGVTTENVLFVGGFLGEEALLQTNQLAQYTCLVGDWSELLLLRGDDFRRLLTTFPELQQRIAFFTRGKEKGVVGQDVLGEHEHQLRMQQDAIANSSKQMRGGGRRASTMGGQGADGGSGGGLGEKSKRTPLGKGKSCPRGMTGGAPGAASDMKFRPGRV